MPTTQPLAQQLKAAHPDIDPELLVLVAGAERLASAKSVYAAGNGKWPRWSVERWLAVLSFTFTATATVIGAVFFLGGRYHEIETSVNQAAQDIAAVRVEIREVRHVQAEGQRKVDALKVQIETIEMTDEYYRTHPRRAPVFGPEGSSIR